MKFIKKLFQRKVLVTGCTFLLLGLNAFYLFANYMVKRKVLAEEILEPGTQFTEFKEILAGVPRIGYMTNEDLTPEKNSGHFLQAQYLLSPTIVDLNKPGPVYNIMDYSHVNFLYYMLQKLNADAIKDNVYSKVLAKKRP